MKLDGGKPWFRKWMGFGRTPITGEGWLVVAVGITVFLCGLVGSLLLDSPWSDLFGVAAFLSAVAANVVIFVKTEGDF